ncbi:hypothetical protein ACFBZI_11670 [Moraxella sp. ZJ142]|uniref:hypothetical protein n=1 Tax=Moraxella marmotae TaxID=3344520 RepID=UPI0035D44B73
MSADKRYNEDLVIFLAPLVAFAFLVILAFSSLLWVSADRQFPIVGDKSQKIQKMLDDFRVERYEYSTACNPDTWANQEYREYGDLFKGTTGITPLWWWVSNDSIGVHPDLEAQCNESLEKMKTTYKEMLDTNGVDVGITYGNLLRLQRIHDEERQKVLAVIDQIRDTIDEQYKNSQSKGLNVSLDD